MQHPVWIVPALFCAMWYGKVGWFLPEDEQQDTEELQKAWKNDLEFFQKETPVNASGFKSYKI